MFNFQYLHKPVKVYDYVTRKTEYYGKQIDAATELQCSVGTINRGIKRNKLVMGRYLINFCSRDEFFEAIFPDAAVDFGADDDNETEYC